MSPDDSRTMSTYCLRNLSVPSLRSSVSPSVSLTVFVSLWLYLSLPYPPVYMVFTRDLIKCLAAVYSPSSVCLSVCFCVCVSVRLYPRLFFSICRPDAVRMPVLPFVCILATWAKRLDNRSFTLCLFILAYCVSWKLLKFCAFCIVLDPNPTPVHKPTNQQIDWLVTIYLAPLCHSKIISVTLLLYPRMRLVLQHYEQWQSFWVRIPFPPQFSSVTSGFFYSTVSRRHMYLDRPIGPKILILPSSFGKTYQWTNELGGFRV